MGLKFYLLNVSDNANYEDLLFPLILTDYLKGIHPEAEVTNYAPIRSNWSALGALPTLSYRDFVNDYRDHPEAIVIVGGGGLFNTAWDQLRWRLSPIVVRMYRHRQLRRVLRKLNTVRRTLSPIPIHLPFVLSDEHFKETRVYYNSVGGFPMDHRALDQEDVEHLNRATTRLTVRDHSVVANMKRYDVPLELIPDSALIMSDVFPVTELEKQVRPEIVEFAKGSPYLCVQLGKDLGPKDVDQFIKDLLSEAEASGYRLVLSPIKYRIPHRIGDEGVLGELAERHSKVKMIAPQSLFETMYLIAQSGGYLGTSLHGFITAYSFGVPSFGFSDVGKLKAYIETWTDSVDHLVDPDQKPEIVPRIASYAQERISARCNLQKKEVYANLGKIADFANA